MNDNDRFTECFEIARKRQETHGTPEFIKTAWCGHCKKSKPHGEFHKFSTDLVKDVRDEVCLPCAVEFKKEQDKLCKLVCCGCKETVRTFQPKPGAAGFNFEPGGKYHVANCPVCSDKVEKTSQIIEMIWFYNSRGIPYQ